MHLAKRRLPLIPLIAVLSLAVGACGGSGSSAAASQASSPPTVPSPAGGGGGGGGSTAFSLSGGVSGQLTIKSSDCRKGSGQDIPMQFTFTGTIDGLDYQVNVGGLALTTGSYDLAGQAVIGVTVQSNPTATGSAPRVFWAAPLRAPNPDASGTVTATVTDSGGSGQVDAHLVQEDRGSPTAGGSTVHLTGTWSCTFS